MLIHMVAEVYLMEKIDKACLSASRLEEEEEKIKRKMDDISIEIEKEKQNFDRQAKVCINTIKERIQSDLDGTIPTISAMIENGTDITEKINSVVRRSVRIGINTEFEPKLKKYVEHISEMITIEFPENELIVDNLGNVLKANVVDEVTKTALPVILAGVGFVLNPIGAVIGGILGVTFDILHNVKSNKKKEKEIDKATKAIVAEVSKQTATSIENEITKYIEKINGRIEQDVLKKKAVLEKSLSDIRIDISIEENTRSQDIEDLEKDLKVIKEFRNDNPEKEEA